MNDNPLNMDGNTALAGLSSAESKTDHFSSNLEAIFTLDMAEIIKKLESLPMPTLKAIREHLVQELRKLFLEFCEREMIARKSAKLLAHDIYVIGISVVSKMEDRRLRTSFRPVANPPAESGPAESSAANDNILDRNSDLFAIVANLKTLVLSQQDIIKEMQERINILEEDATISKIEIHNLRHQPDTEEDDDDDDLTEVKRVNGSEMQNGLLPMLSAQQPSTVSPDPVSSVPRQNDTNNPRGLHAATSEQSDMNRLKFKITAAPPSQLTPKTDTNSSSKNKSTPNQKIYIGRLGSTTTSGELMSHLNSIIELDRQDVCELKQLRKRGFASFSLTLNRNCNPARIFNTDLWPQGVVIRPFADDQPTERRMTSRRIEPAVHHSQQDEHCRCMARSCSQNSHTFPSQRSRHDPAYLCSDNGWQHEDRYHPNSGQHHLGEWPRMDRRQQWSEHRRSHDLSHEGRDHDTADQYHNDRRYREHRRSDYLSRERRDRDTDQYYHNRRYHEDSNNHHSSRRW